MLQAGLGAYPFAKAATPFISTIQKVSVWDVKYFFAW